MKLHFTAIAMLLLLLCHPGKAKKTELFSSKYFSFQSNQQLNAHLFLYNKAISCKFANVPDDSLALKVLNEKAKTLSNKDLFTLNTILRFYKDSLLTKDLLFDSLMRNFTDYLALGNSSKIKLKANWQLTTFENLKLFQPYFTKLYWPAIDSSNKAWLNTYKTQIIAMEDEIVPQLEKIYKTKLPEGKVRVDLSNYATWAGAYSFNDFFCHIIFSSTYKANQGNLAAEVLFHETSHFLVDKLIALISAAAKNKHAEKEPAVWHDMIFYTTGFVLEKYYKLKWEKFEPYYVQMKFPDKFPAFKTNVDACKLYWDPYLNGQTDFDVAVNNLVTYVLEKQK